MKIKRGRSRRQSWKGWRCLKQTGVNGLLKVGTDFAGMETPILALGKLGLRHKHLWSCEILPAAQRFIKRIMQPQHLYRNALTRKVARMPYVHILFSGPPCQAFSMQSKRLGLLDPRGSLVDATLAYIEYHKPAMVILENVVGLQCGSMRELLVHILERLVHAGYDVNAQVLNTNDYGLPQNRPRIYIIGILNGPTTKSFEFPASAGVRIPLQSLVSPFHGAAWRRAPVVGYRRANVLKRYAEKISEGIDIWKQPVVIDAGSSAKFSRSYVGEVPCLTARRFHKTDLEFTSLGS